jgi:hypothetical protein
MTRWIVVFRPGQGRKNKSPGIGERSLFHLELFHSD